MCVHACGVCVHACDTIPFVWDHDFHLVSECPAQK